MPRYYPYRERVVPIVPGPNCPIAINIGNLTRVSYKITTIAGGVVPPAQWIYNDTGETVSTTYEQSVLLIIYNPNEERLYWDFVKYGTQITIPVGVHFCYTANVTSAAITCEGVLVFTIYYDSFLMNQIFQLLLRPILLHML